MVYLEKYLIFLVPIIIIIALILATWKKAPQDKAIVVTKEKGYKWKRRNCDSVF